MNTIIVTDKTILYGFEVTASSLWCLKNTQCNLQNPKLKLQYLILFMPMFINKYTKPKKKIPTRL